jgi:hypothetical protein
MLSVQWNNNNNQPEGSDQESERLGYARLVSTTMHCLISDGKGASGGNSGEMVVSRAAAEATITALIVSELALVTCEWMALLTAFGRG